MAGIDGSLVVYVGRMSWSLMRQAGAQVSSSSLKRTNGPERDIMTLVHFQVKWRESAVTRSEQGRYRAKFMGSEWGC